MARAQAQTMATNKNPNVSTATPTTGRRTRPATNGNRAQTPRTPKPAPEQTTVEEHIEAQDAANENAEPETEAAAPAAPDADDAIVAAYRTGQTAEAKSLTASVPDQRLEMAPTPRTRRTRSASIEQPASSQPTEEDLKQLGAFALMAIQQDKPMSVLADELEQLLNTYRKFGVPF